MLSPSPSHKRLTIREIKSLEEIKLIRIQHSRRTKVSHFLNDDVGVADNTSDTVSTPISSTHHNSPALELLRSGIIRSLGIRERTHDHTFCTEGDCEILIGGDGVKVALSD